MKLIDILKDQNKIGEYSDKPRANSCITAETSYLLATPNLEYNTLLLS